MAGHGGMLLLQEKIVVDADVETVNHSSLNARRRSPVNASTRSISHRGSQFRTLQPCCSALVRYNGSSCSDPVSRKRNQVGFYRSLDGYSFTTEIPRWRKRQLRNAKPPPCCCNSARFTSELRVASEPCESRESTSWRSSIGNWENIAIGEANLRNETLHGEQMTSNNLSILSYSSWLYYKHVCLAFIGSKFLFFYETSSFIETTINTL